MQRSIALKRATATAILVLLTASAVAATPSADQVMQKAYAYGKIGTLKSEAEMILENDRGQRRERKLSIESKLQKNRIDTNLLIRFVAPADIKGTAFLQIEHSTGDDDLWIYLPALHKNRRLVANNRRDSFVGSDFSYGDILPPNPSRYVHRLLRTESYDAQRYYVIESIPRDASIKADSGYSKKVTWIAADPGLESKIEYYDDDGQLLKTQRLSDYRPAGSKRHYLALKREMVNHQTGHRTLFSLNEPLFDVFIPDNQFSARILER